MIRGGTGQMADGSYQLHLLQHGWTSSAQHFRVTLGHMGDGFGSEIRLSFHFFKASNFQFPLQEGSNTVNPKE